MGKRRPVFKMYSYGEYSGWDRNSSEIPKILDFSTDIKASIGTEFGYVLHIKNGKGEILEFKIDHPPFTDDEGNIRPPFTGEQFIRTNDYQFYLGDCIWEPLEDKLGKWEITTYYKGEVVAHKIFNLK
ncbi:DUF3859 domain-containing protein [Maribellus sediminis]|uniref:DUF3859 domain-containing protein n=1 Tax=Maribellus sediminis TaxID=2696285 RepID=UPI00143077CB|nr:DUF3859 domain-containing protein [Maribellus sediminis]